MNRLIGNRVTERDIRDWLSRQGIYGNSARFAELELHAIQRPGWYQIFRFSVTARSEGDDEWQEWHGMVQDDERYRRTEVQIFKEIRQRDAALESASAGLIVKRSRRPRSD